MTPGTGLTPILAGVFILRSRQWAVSVGSLRLRRRRWLNPVSAGWLIGKAVPVGNRQQSKAIGNSAMDYHYCPHGIQNCIHLAI